MIQILAAVVLSQADGGTCTAYPAATNFVRSSQDLKANWLSYGGCDVDEDLYDAPTCAESFNARGCGLRTAGRLTCPAVASGVNAFVYQNAGCPTGVASGAVYAAVVDGGGGVAGLYVAGVLQVCELSGSWQRCKAENGSSDTTFAMGNFGGSGARPALDVKVWQADCQNSSVVLPPIPTGAHPVSRESGCVASGIRKVAGLGDSIMLASGTGLPQVGVRVADALGPDYGWIAAGVAGDTCGDVRDRWASVKSQGTTHLVVMCGVNDARTGRTAEQAWADEEAVLVDALDAGIRVRLVKTLNFEGAGDADAAKIARINTLRGYQQAWCDARGLACADPAVALQTGDALKTALRQDATHPNADGSSIFVTHIASWPGRWAEGW